MNANNTYFENLKRLGWDSEKLKTWYVEKEAMKFPFEQGARKAYRAWAQSISRKEDELEMDDFLWDKEVKDFIAALRRAARCLVFAPSRDRKPAGETKISPRSWAFASS